MNYVGYIGNVDRFVNDTHGLRPVALLDAKFIVTVQPTGKLRCQHTYWDGTLINGGLLDTWQDVIRVVNILAVRTKPFRLLMLIRVS